MMLCTHIVYDFRPYWMNCFSLRKCLVLLIWEVRRHKIHYFKLAVSIENHRQMWEVSDKQNKTRDHKGLGNDQNFASSFATLRQEANIRDSFFFDTNQIYTLMLVYCKLKYLDLQKTVKLEIILLSLFWSKNYQILA